MAEKIAIAGTGYVGMSVATLLAQHNHVVAVDLIPEKVDMVNRKKSPVQDEYIERYLRQVPLDLRATLDALPTLFLPVLILGGIYAGFFTPTESAAFGTVYALCLGFGYRELRLRDLKRILVKSAETSAMVCFIISVANILSWIMASTQASNAIVSGLMSFVSDKFTFLLVMNLFLILVGALLDQGAAVIIICPMLFSLGTSLGIDPLHLALVMCVNLVLGNVTPPFGYNLFTATSISGLKFVDVVKGTMPFLLIEIAVLFFLAYCEPVVLWLPRLAGY